MFQKANHPNKKPRFRGALRPVRRKGGYQAARELGFASCTAAREGLECLMPFGSAGDYKIVA
jgi:hypothetical protein